MTFFAKLPSMNKSYQILCRCRYTCIYLDQHSLLDLQIQISNYLIKNLCLNFLIVDLVCKKYIDLLLFRDRNITFLLTLKRLGSEKYIL